MRAGYIAQPVPVPLLLTSLGRRQLAGLGATQADCGARGWTGSDCLCPAGQVAQEGGTCYAPPTPVGCPAITEALVTTTNFPQGICVPGDVDFSNPANAYLGKLIAVLQGHLAPVTNPLQLITTVYGPLTPGTTGSGVTPLPQRSVSGGGGVIAQLLNLDRPGAAEFQIGERFQVSIAGAPPGAAVTIAATQDGKSLGTTTYGTVAGDGTFSLTGTMGQANVGQWTETWKVGAVTVLQVSFSVSTPTGTGAGAGAGAASGVTTGPGPSTGFQPLQTAEGFLAKPLFDGVPMWGALLAAVVGGGWLLSRRR